MGHTYLLAGQAEGLSSYASVVLRSLLHTCTDHSKSASTEYTTEYFFPAEEIKMSVQLYLVLL